MAYAEELAQNIPMNLTLIIVKKMNKPDKWVVVKITNSNGEIIYKVFATWLGGYLDGDYWKMNSGIVRVDKDGDLIRFFGESGSCYECVDSGYSYGTNYYTQGVLDNMISKATELGHQMEVMPQDTDWMNIINLENEKA